MSTAQQRGLALWAALLSAVVCLWFLPASRLVSILVLLAVLGLIIAFWAVACRRVQHDFTLCLEDLPEANYCQPVVLVCGDLPLAWPHQSPVLTVTQGCWIRVEDHLELEQAARQVLWLRPDWGRQLSVMVSVCPQQHPDSERLTSRLLALRWQISRLRKATGHSVPLVLNGQVGSAMMNDMLWQTAILGEGVKVWSGTSAPGSVAEWVNTGGTPAMQQQVLMNSLMSWFQQHVQAVLMDENPDIPVIEPVAVLWGLGPILAGSMATSVWTAWLSRHTAMQQVSGWQPAGTDSTVISLFPNFVLPLLPEGRGLTPHGRTWRGALGIFTLATIAALLSSGWNNRQLLQRVSFDIARYERIPMNDFGPKADAVAVLREDAALLDDHARNGVPLSSLMKDEQTELLSLEHSLAKRVVGQDSALNAIAQRLRASKTGLAPENGPQGVFLLVGPSGTGKTETALALADELFGGEKSLITINLSEYQEPHTVSQLKGSPPGYVGYGQGGILTEAVRKRPYSVVLLDEVEKAHRDVMNLFYQVFDRGVIRHERYLNDQTQTVAFTSCPELSPGMLLKVTGGYEVADVFAQGVVVTAMHSHAQRDADFCVRFDGIPDSTDFSFRPEPGSRPVMAGTLPARVTSTTENDTYGHIDKDGRYRVNMLFDRENWETGFESLWVRQSRPYAGNTYGLHLPLLAGTEVAIGFEDGNPDRPYIAGVLHDSAHGDHVTIRNYRRNVLRTPANNKIRLDDERGKEHIKVSTEYGGKSQLNLGHLVDSDRQKRGEGFELRTDSWGAIRAQKGIFISADGQAKAQGQVLEMQAAMASGHSLSMRELKSSAH